LDPRTQPTLLLIEDSRADAYVVRLMLETVWAGFDTLTHVPTIAQARPILLERAIDCVLLDLSLPDADQLEGLEAVKAVAPTVPIVVLTGHADEALALRALHEGAQDYLIKGQVEPEVLARAIRYSIERQAAETELAHQSTHDPLTGLPNRLLFLDRLALALARLARRPSMLAVMFLDIDGFKFVNDSLGHDVGDELLRAVAGRLRRVLRPGDTVARFGGDEYTILSEDIREASEAVRIAERLRAALRPPFPLAGRDVFITASIGIVMATDSDQRPEHLLRDADAAMYQAKDRGKARYEMFDEMMRLRVARRLETESGLHRAIERGEFALLFQPEIDLEDSTTLGVEALVSWQHSTRGLVGPSEFIAVAEETGLIVPIGTWVLREACTVGASWRSRMDPERPFMMSVNLSARQLLHPGLADQVAAVLDETGFPARDLVVEVTESVLIEDALHAGSVLDDLQKLGVRLCIDDFGTGYASLTYLRRFPVDILKIDQAFVQSLGTGADDAAIVEAVLGLAERLELMVIAEGVEEEHQARALKEMGCRVAQGYHFSVPLAAAEVENLLGI
jgi:diguanylate cyclase (GGDEF)-like protein